MPMISYADARAHVLARCTRLSPRTVDLDDAAGSVLATDVVAAEAVPPFANSAMDGYAIRADDVEGASPASPVRLRVVGTVLAGQAGDLDVGTGCAARIMTGAPMPRERTRWWWSNGPRWSVPMRCCCPKALISAATYAQPETTSHRVTWCWRRERCSLPRT